jgi:pimeloyl-ACP methyl ester carboxylesterase
MTSESPPKTLTRSDGTAIAYHRLEGRGPGLVFLGGFRSDMTGTKALHLEAYARARGLAFLRFDYRGHGQSSGDFEAATIGDWAGDAIGAIGQLTEGPQVLVGSSMGGWIMLLAARALDPPPAALVGIAAAPDFTEDLMWESFSEELQAKLLRDGRIEEESPYSEEPTVITLRLIEEGRRHLLLRAPIPIRCPVRLLHGMADPDVPYAVSLKLCERLASRDVEVTLVKDGDHRLSEPPDLTRLDATLDALYAQL